jgi:hypothetical protein
MPTTVRDGAESLKDSQEMGTLFNEGLAELQYCSTLVVLSLSSLSVSYMYTCIAIPDME